MNRATHTLNLEKLNQRKPSALSNAVRIFK